MNNDYTGLTHDEAFAKMFENTYSAFIVKIAKELGTTAQELVNTSNENPQFRTDLGNTFLEAIKDGLAENNKVAI